MQIIIALIVLGILVIIHEFGHFIVAKSCRIKVHEFSVGMGPKIASRKKKETEYSLRALPIGGYVKMEGEDEASTDDRAFNNKPPYKRLAVVVAGPVMNFILAILIFILLLSAAPIIPLPVVDKVTKNSPAQEAGIQPGDRIVKINNNNINIQRDVIYYLAQSKGKPVDIVIKRGNSVKEVNITPELNEEYGRHIIGYMPKMVEPNVFNIVTNGYYETLFLSKAIVVSLSDLITGKIGTDQIAGPVGIVTTIGEASQQGISNLLFLAAFISISFGIFNMLPLPALDGGRLLFIIVEVIRRKPVDPEKEGFIHFIGFAILIALMIFVTYNDIARLLTK